MDNPLSYQEAGGHNPGRMELYHYESLIQKVRNLSEVKERVGGGERDRTADLYVANVALSQLSYTPDDAQN